MSDHGTRRNTLDIQGRDETVLTGRAVGRDDIQVRWVKIALEKILCATRELMQVGAVDGESLVRPEHGARGFGDGARLFGHAHTGQPLRQRDLLVGRIMHVDHGEIRAGGVQTAARLLPRFNKGDCLFSTTFGAKPVNGFSKAKERLDKHMRSLGRAVKIVALHRSSRGSSVSQSPIILIVRCLAKADAAGSGSIDSTKLAKKAPSSGRFDLLARPRHEAGGELRGC